MSSYYLQKDLFKKNLLTNILHWKENLLSLKYVKNFIDAFNDEETIEFLNSQYIQELKEILIHKDENFRMEGI